MAYDDNNKNVIGRGILIRLVTCATGCCSPTHIAGADGTDTVSRDATCISENVLHFGCAIYTINRFFFYYIET